MAPDPRELDPGRPLRLRNLVFVVRKNEIHAPAVDVERVAEMLASHRRALQMPARAAESPWRLPGGAGALILGLGRLPEGKVSYVFLVIVVRRDAGARLDLPRVQPRELAVAREPSDGEIHRAVVRPVGQPAPFQLLHQLDHLRDVLGRLRIHLGLLDAQKFPIVVKDLGDRLGDLRNRQAALFGTRDDLVIDVGQVHHLHHAPPAKAQRTPEQILEQERAKVADVRRVVDGGTARVHAHGVFVGRRERLDRTGHRVVQAELRHAAPTLSAVRAP